MSFLNKSRPILRRITNIARLGCRGFSEEPVDKSKPVKFSTSEAANWRAAYTRKGNIDDDTPEAQTYVVCLSMAAFLTYFLLLREESDIDQRFNLFEDNLYEKVDGLEEVDLRTKRKRLLAANRNVDDIDKRLEEIEKEKLAKAL